MSPETKARLEKVAALFRGRDCFPEATARARKLLAGLKEWPHEKYPELFGSAPKAPLGEAAENQE